MKSRRWSKQEFHQEMQWAGWEWDGERKIFIHSQTGAEFDPRRTTKWREKKYGNGEAWYEFALLRVLPTEAPF